MSLELVNAFKQWDRERQQSLEDFDRQSLHSKAAINLGTNPFMDSIDFNVVSSVQDKAALKSNCFSNHLIRMQSLTDGKSSSKTNIKQQSVCIKDSDPSIYYLSRSDSSKMKPPTVASITNQVRYLSRPLSENKATPSLSSSSQAIPQMKKHLRRLLNQRSTTTELSQKEAGKIPTASTRESGFGLGEDELVVDENPEVELKVCQLNHLMQETKFESFKQQRSHSNNKSQANSDLDYHHPQQQQQPNTSLQLSPQPASSYSSQHDHPQSLHSSQLSTSAHLSTFKATHISLSKNHRKQFDQPQQQPQQQQRLQPQQQLLQPLQPLQLQKIRHSSTHVCPSIGYPMVHHRQQSGVPDFSSYTPIKMRPFVAYQPSELSMHSDNFLLQASRRSTAENKTVITTSFATALSKPENLNYPEKKQLSPQPLQPPPPPSSSSSFLQRSQDKCITTSQISQALQYTSIIQPSRFDRALSRCQFKEYFEQLHHSENSQPAAALSNSIQQFPQAKNEFTNFPSHHHYPIPLGDRSFGYPPSSSLHPPPRFPGENLLRSTGSGVINKTKTPADVQRQFLSPVIPPQPNHILPISMTNYEEPSQILRVNKLGGYDDGGNNNSDSSIIHTICGSELNDDYPNHTHMYPSQVKAQSSNNIYHQQNELQAKLHQVYHSNS